MKRSIWNLTEPQADYWNPPIEFDNQAAAESREAFVREVAMRLFVRGAGPSDAIRAAEELAAELEDRA